MSAKAKQNWKRKLHEVIYEADTSAGKWFDIILLFLILASIVVVMLESVSYIDKEYHAELDIAEWIITILFTFEYIARIVVIKKPSEYIFSFYGLVDFFSTIPKYLSLFLIGTHALVALRALRLLRVFRILKLARFIGEGNQLANALKASKAKILVFLMAIFMLCIILGTVMYMIEGGSGSGFTSIPRSVYWAIVTLTTVGYGDIAPVTALGQFIASIIMILGYAVIAVPTGIVSAEMTKKKEKKVHLNTRSCPNCAAEYHRDDAQFCYECGTQLNE
ncbi:MAG: ion transporter [Flavobacteriaceae bacterium]|nr:ion transporter [Flavobacteriaceae bacterium]